MTYTLAKRLKDAGFPQEGNGQIAFSGFELLGFSDPLRGIKPPHLYSDEEKSKIRGANSVYIPNLGELIDACGEDFPMLARNARGWECCEYDEMRWTGGWNVMSNGQTPEEAVARFWLVLNMKRLVNKK